MLSNSILLSMLLSAAQSPGDAPSDEVEPRQILGVRRHAPIRLDGRPDDPVWQRAPVQRGFRERTPDLGAQDRLGTSLQVAYDDQALYLLVSGTLGGDSPVIRTLRRDANSVWSDDTVTVKIDPAHDRRSIIYFASNLAGSQTDGMVLNDGADHIQLDAVWEVEGSHEGRQFYLEYKIPWYTLGVRGRDDLTLGLNISRDDPHRGAVYDWRLIVPPRRPTSASTAGTVELDGPLHTRPMVELVPYALARTDFRRRFSVDPRKQPNLAAGMDARVQTGPGGYVEASVLTDFSQVDLDEVQVAANRFALYFPERRAFFINGLDVFNFGYIGSAQLFFSRRIGMDGMVSPIAGGVKAYGRSAKLSYGLLNVQTLSAFSISKDGETTRMRAPENFSVGRLRVQALPQLAVGVLGVARKRLSGQPGDALQGGVDVEVRSLDTRFRGYGFVAATWGEDDDDDCLPKNPSPLNTHSGWTASAEAQYRGLYFRPSLRWLWSSEGFKAPVGFFRRAGTSQKSASFYWVPRPTAMGLRDIRTGPYLELTTTPRLDKVLTVAPGYLLEFNWRNQWTAALDSVWERDHVQRGFSLYEGFEVPAGQYDNAGVGLAVNSPGRHLVSAGAAYVVSSKFGGVEHAPRMNLNARLGSHFALTASYGHRFGHLGDRDHWYNFGFLNAQTVVAVHRNLVWDTLFRLNFSPQRERFDIQSRLRWRYRPGSDIYLVYARHTPLGTPRDDDPMAQSLALKANFFFAAPVGRRRR